MRNYELVYDTGKEVMRRVGLFTFGLIGMYFVLTELIPLLIVANTILKALVLLSILIYVLCIILLFFGAFK